MAEDYHFNMSDAMFESLSPVGSHVIIKIKDDRKEHNRIILTNLTPVIPDKGEVVKVSKTDCLDNIFVGSKVVFERYMGRKIYVGKCEYLLLHVDHILAVLPDTADVGIKHDSKLT